METLILDYHLITNDGNSIYIHQENPLTEIEKKIVLAMISMVNLADEEDKVYELSIQEFYDILEIPGLDSNLQFEEIIDELLSKLVEIPRENGGWVMTHWVVSVRYIEDSEMVQFRLPTDLKPYFLQLKKYL